MNFVDKDGTTKLCIPVHPWGTGKIVRNVFCCLSIGEWASEDNLGDKNICLSLIDVIFLVPLRLSARLVATMCSTACFHHFQVIHYHGDPQTKQTASSGYL